jgi:hypothetical protein
MLDCPHKLLKGGKNNRVYEAHHDGRKVLVKEYFQHPSDP